jgi:DNA topoisomerase-1
MKRSNGGETPHLETLMAGQLEYVSDETPGFSRRRCGKGFSYRDSHGKRITDAAQLARIRALAIPPAYENVWISPDARGHIQATARDARGRKQYLYHAQWRAIRDGTKFDRMRRFAHALPGLRRKIARDLALDGLPKEKVLAAVVKLLDRTGIRVGNEEYVRENGSYGLTTLRNRHVAVKGEEMHFEFRGKSGVPHQVTLKDRRLARVIRRCLDIPGQELFQYVDADGARRAITSQAVNAYLQALARMDITAKDFRTWAGSVLAYDELRRSAVPAPDAKRPPSPRSRMVAALKAVSARLGNTPAVCKRSYVHPAIMDACESGDLDAEPASRRGLTEAERRFLGFLERDAHHAHEKKPATRAGETQRSQEIVVKLRLRRGKPRDRATGWRGSGKTSERPRTASTR